MQKAAQLRKTNIAEYILYFWQIEDLLRAAEFDLSKILSRYNLTDSELRETELWYDNIVQMMRMEHVTANGHLQIIKNIIIDLNDLHLTLLRMPAEYNYAELYSEILPHTNVFESKLNQTALNTVDVWFHALYTTVLLKMQKKEISEETLDAVAKFGKILSRLTKAYHHREKEPDYYLLD